MDMAIAVNEIIRTQGGYTVVENGKVYETLALPIMGLMSDVGFENVNEALQRMIQKAHQMGVASKIDPFVTPFISGTSSNSRASDYTERNL